MAAAAIEFVATLRARVQTIAETGEAEISEWPETLNFLIRLFEHIVIHEFPLPHTYSRQASREPDFSQQQKHTDRPSTPTHDEAESTTPTDDEPSSLSLSDGLARSSKPWLKNLPAEASDKCEWIYSCLIGNFATTPPCTIQRICELLIAPRALYRFLPSYLNALDRLVSVSNPALVFSFPATSVPAGFMSDQTISGAQLVPIPWLSELDVQLENSHLTADDGGLAITDHEDTIQASVEMDPPITLVSETIGHDDDSDDSDDDDDEDDESDDDDIHNMTRTSSRSIRLESSNSSIGSVDMGKGEDTPKNSSSESPNSIPADDIDYLELDGLHKTSLMKRRDSPQSPQSDSGGISPDSGPTGRKRPVSEVLDKDSPVSPRSKMRTSAFSKIPSASEPDLSMSSGDQSSSGVTSISVSTSDGKDSSDTSSSSQSFTNSQLPDGIPSPVSDPLDDQAASAKYPTDSKERHSPHPDLGSALSAPDDSSDGADVSESGSPSKSPSWPSSVSSTTSSSENQKGKGG